MLMSLRERPKCKLFSGVDTACNYQEKPVNIKCFYVKWTQVQTHIKLFLWSWVLIKKKAWDKHECKNTNYKQVSRSRLNLHLHLGWAPVCVTVAHLCRWILQIQEEHYFQFNLFSTEPGRQHNHLTFLLWLTVNWNHHNSHFTSLSPWHVWPEIQLPSQTRLSFSTPESIFHSPQWNCKLALAGCYFSITSSSQPTPPQKRPHLS